MCNDVFNHILLLLLNHVMSVVQLQLVYLTFGTVSVQMTTQQLPTKHNATLY